MAQPERFGDRRVDGNGSRRYLGHVHPKRALVAGASSVLGRGVLRRLEQRGWQVRALSRRRSKLPAAPGEVFVADALTAKELQGAAEGCTAVFSCVGASVQLAAGHGWRGYRAVDTPANLNLIHEARRAGARRFVYVSTYHSPDMARLSYVRAHEDVVRRLETSGLDFAVVRPTGFFSALAALVPLALRGGLPVFGNGAGTSNPIHDDDLAAVCAEAMEGSEQVIEAGGPETFSRLHMNEVAFRACGLAPRHLHLPRWFLKAAAVPVTLVHPRIADFLRFIDAISTRELLAPVRGSQRLGPFLAEVADRLLGRPAGSGLAQE